MNISTAQQIFPVALLNVDLDTAYAYPQESKTYLRINMVSSLDGVIAIDGQARELSSDADRRIYRAMRNLADVILVGAGTLRKEKYKAAKIDDEAQKFRKERDQNALPPIAIVSRSGLFNWDTPIFTDTKVKPIIFTTSEGKKVAAEGSDYADIIDCGKDIVDLNKVVKELSDRSLNKILCEGGPTLNAHLHKAGLVDELCLTISPLLVQGVGARIFEGEELTKPANFITEKILIEENSIFLRMIKSNL